MKTLEVHFNTCRQWIKSTGRAIARTWNKHCQLMATNRSYRMGVLAALSTLAVSASGPLGMLVVLATSIYTAYYEGAFPGAGPLLLTPVA